MKRFALVVGTRPNFVKAAAVIASLARRNTRPLLIHTGQHSDPALSDVFFERLGLPEPDHHLGMSGGSRGEHFGAIVAALAKLLPTLDLDEVIVVGDVTSTAAGAVAADACDLPVAHVEAGLRSFDWTMPEERNRRIVDVLASHLLASEPSGVSNLAAEGARPDRVHLVGNVMIDVLLRFREEAQARAPWTRLGVSERGYVLATLHRPANVDAPNSLEQCLAVLGEAGRRWPVLFSVHPRTQAKLRTFGLAVPPSIHLLPPLDYVEFIGLMAGAVAVCTDSGGAQEETTVLGVPCLTMRDNTERPITVELGTSRLVGRSRNRTREVLDQIQAGAYPAGQPIPLWDGCAGDRVADVLLS